MLRNSTLPDRLRWLPLGLAMIGALGFAACSDDEDDEAVAEVQAAYDRIQAGPSPEEALDLVTDDFAENAFGGLVTNEEAVADPAPVVQDYEIDVDGDTATLDGVEVLTVEDSGVSQTGGTRWTFKKEDDTWKLDDIEPREIDGPDGAPDVGVRLLDFAFEFDEDDFEAGEALAITAENDGDQPHIIVLVKVEEGVDLQEALESEEEPEGITTILDFFWNEGDTGTVYTTQELEAGDYAMICFLPDVTDPANKPPHFEQGMLSEFTVD